jgi:hypothetical protein
MSTAAFSGSSTAHAGDVYVLRISMQDDASKLLVRGTLVDPSLDTIPIIISPVPTCLLTYVLVVLSYPRST